MVFRQSRGEIDNDFPLCSRGGQSQQGQAQNQARDQPGGPLSQAGTIAQRRHFLEALQACQEARPDRITLERGLQAPPFQFRNGHGGIGEGRQNSECEPDSIPGSCVHGKLIVDPWRLSLNPENPLTTNARNAICIVVLPSSLLLLKFLIFVDLPDDPAAAGDP